MRVAGYGAYDGLTYLLMDAGWFCALADRELRAGGVYTYDSTNCGARQAWRAGANTSDIRYIAVRAALMALSRRKKHAI